MIRVILDITILGHLKEMHLNVKNYIVILIANFIIILKANSTPLNLLLPFPSTLHHTTSLYNVKHMPDLKLPPLPSHPLNVIEKERKVCTKVA